MMSGSLPHDMAHDATSADAAVEALQGNKPTQLPLSKNAQKKLVKAERMLALKAERRTREKAAKKEKRKERAQKRAAGEEVDKVPSRKRARLDGPSRPFEARVVVDLSFDDKMIDKEITSLCSQLAYTYSANRKATQPFSSLLFTSLNGRTFTRLESLGDASYKRWTGTEWWPTGYDHLWASGDGDKPCEDVAAPLKSLQTSPKDQVVYLTADSDNELSELKEGETYIIGGLCDHNRYKNLCESKAKEGGIRSARLPIGTYLAHMSTRKVLTVNQVFDILLQWVETRDWEKALYNVIPKRKFLVTQKDEAGSSGEPGETGCESDEDIETVVEQAAGKELANGE